MSNLVSRETRIFRTFQANESSAAAKAWSFVFGGEALSARPLVGFRVPGSATSAAIPQSVKAGMEGHIEAEIRSITSYPIEPPSSRLRRFLLDKYLDARLRHPKEVTAAARTQIFDSNPWDFEGLLGDVTMDLKDLTPMFGEIFRQAIIRIVWGNLTTGDAGPKNVLLPSDAHLQIAQAQPMPQAPPTRPIRQPRTENPAAPAGRADEAVDDHRFVPNDFERIVLPRYFQALPESLEAIWAFISPTADEFNAAYGRSIIRYAVAGLLHRDALVSAAAAALLRRIWRNWPNAVLPAGSSRHSAAVIQAIFNKVWNWIVMEIGDTSYIAEVFAAAFGGNGPQITDPNEYMAIGRLILNELLHLDLTRGQLLTMEKLSRRLLLKIYGQRVHVAPDTAAYLEKTYLDIRARLSPDGLDAGILQKLKIHAGPLLEADELRKVDVSAAKSLLLERIPTEAREYYFWSEIANLEFMLGQYQAAITSAKKALSLMPEWSFPHSAAAKAYEKMIARADDPGRMIRHAIKHRVAEVAADPTDYTGRFYLALLYERVGRIYDALFEINTVVSFQPQHEAARAVADRLARAA